MKKTVFLSFVLWVEVASGQVTYPLGRTSADLETVDWQPML